VSRFAVGDLVYYFFDDFKTYLCRVSDEPYHDFGDTTRPLRYPLLVLEAWRTGGRRPRSEWKRDLEDPCIDQKRNILDDYDWKIRPVPVVDQLAALVEAET
jgi:hypothetical protein